MLYKIFERKLSLCEGAVIFMTVTERFIKYTSFGTSSDEECSACPSSKGQRVLGEYLKEELQKMGVSGVKLDGNGYLYGHIPATDETMPKIGLIAHMDTSPDVCSDGVRAQKIKYEGGDLSLNEEVKITPADYPILYKMKGKTLITSDGTTLLGADDKAGIAEIFSALEYLLAHPQIKHGKISVGITPDEEIGRGADLFDIENFDADFAYTVDGGVLGEIEYENFNAASAKITVHGINIHPGEAKNKMKNAILLANKFISMLPDAETPAHTEGYEGFYHVNDIRGDETQTVIRMIIRDHDRDKFEKRKCRISDLCVFFNSVWGKGTFEAEIHDSYYNMKEKIEPHFHIIERAIAAITDCGVTPKIVPIRGGTDGARLSYMGLPCPNLSTGGVNFHSVREFVPAEDMEKMVEIIVAAVTK